MPFTRCSLARSWVPLRSNVVESRLKKERLAASAIGRGSISVSSGVEVKPFESLPGCPLLLSQKGIALQLFSDAID